MLCWCVKRCVFDFGCLRAKVSPFWSLFERLDRLKRRVWWVDFILVASLFSLELSTLSFLFSPCNLQQTNCSDDSTFKKGYIIVILKRSFFCRLSQNNQWISACCFVRAFSIYYLLKFLLVYKNPCFLYHKSSSAIYTHNSFYLKPSIYSNLHNQTSVEIASETSTLARIYREFPTPRDHLL